MPFLLKKIVLPENDRNNTQLEIMNKLSLWNKLSLNLLMSSNWGKQIGSLIYLATAVLH